MIPYLCIGIHVALRLFGYCDFSFEIQKYVTSVSTKFLRQACSPLIQLFFGFASESSDIDQTNINRDIRDGKLSKISVLHNLGRNEQL